MQDIFTLGFPQFFFLVLESGLGQRTRYPPGSFFKTFEMKFNLHFSVSAKKEILCSSWSSLKVRKSLKQFCWNYRAQKPKQTLQKNLPYKASVEALFVSSYFEKRRYRNLVIPLGEPYIIHQGKCCRGMWPGDWIAPLIRTLKSYF